MRLYVGVHNGQWEVERDAFRCAEHAQVSASAALARGANQLSECLCCRRPAQDFERCLQVAPAVPVMLPVEEWLPVVWRLDRKASHLNSDHRRVIPAPPLCRFLGERIDVLDDFDASAHLRGEPGFFVEFSSRGLWGRFSRLDAAGDHVPVASLPRRAVQEKNFAPTLAGYEHRDLRPSSHRCESRPSFRCESRRGMGVAVVPY